MKRLILLIALLLAGCGQGETDFDISMTTIVWSGYPSQDTEHFFQQDLSETLFCLSAYGFSKDGEPFSVVLKSSFACNEQNKSAVGCYFNGTVYVAESAIYPLYTGNGFNTFKHEVIHWIAENGNESHNEEYFTKCVGY